MERLSRCGAPGRPAGAGRAGGSHRVVLAAVFGGPAGGRPAGEQRHCQGGRRAFDDHPDNEPHVGCIFQIDWYGFDEGDFFARHFEVHPPTGKPGLLEDDVFIGEDDNSGGDPRPARRSETYDLARAAGSSRTPSRVGT